MSEFNYEIVRHLATLSDDGYGHTLQVNFISYNGGKPKLDIRRWQGDRMFKGVALNDTEAEALYKALEEWTNV